MEFYLAQILFFGGGFAPRNFMFCAGQVLGITQNTALFSVIGTVYGGNGQQTFALPDARGRAFLGAGQGPGLTDRQIGQMAGNENTTLLSTNLPQHAHTLTGTASASLQAVTNNTDANTSGRPSAGARLGTPLETGGTTAAPVIYVPVGSGDTVVNLGGIALEGNTGITGNSSPISNLQPFTVVNAIICTEGLYPSRN